MSGIYSIKTRPNGYSVPYLADTTLYNQIRNLSDNELPKTLWSVTGLESIEAAADAINEKLIAMGAVGRPPVALTSLEGKDPRLSLAVTAIERIFPVVYKSNVDNNTETLGNSYACPRYRTSNNLSVQSAFYSSDTAAGNYYGVIHTLAYGSSDYFGASFDFTIHVIPAEAIANGKLVAANLGDRWETVNFIVNAQDATADYSVVMVGHRSNSLPPNQSNLDNIDVEAGQPLEDHDPYTGYPASNAPGGLSGGSFDFTDNGLTSMHTPGIDLLGSGFLTAWNVNKAQLNALANWLWVTTPSQIFQQIYGNPINAVIGLNVVPVAPSVDSGSNTIKFGVEDSQIAAPKITSQYVSVDCGTLTIRPTYGSYMDYGPHSSAELFLPYCGGVPLDINDVVGKTISVKYQVDILSGACVAYIFIDGHLHYQKSGCCAGSAPVTGSQMPNVISGVLSIVGSVAGAIGSLGASGASTAAKVASGIATGTNVADAATNALKRSISYSGTVSGWAGLLGAQKPYLILTLPNAAIPAGQQQLAGYPAWVGGQLSSFSGHTECANVHLNGLRATDEEMTEIRSLLESGVIL